MADSIERIADDVSRLAVAIGTPALPRRNRADEERWCLELQSLATRLRALSPAGGDWVMVPREPTPEMLKTLFSGAHSYDYREGNDYRREELDDYYLSMYRNLLAASPQQEPGATINVNEIDSKSIADPSGQTLAGAVVGCAVDLDNVKGPTLANREEVPPGLLDRIKAAEQRIADGHAPRRIPAEVTDVDLVLAEVRAWIEGKHPPFWVETLTATSAGTTGQVDWRWQYVFQTQMRFMDQGVPTSRAKTMAEQDAQSLEAAARRAREVG